jgi:hypothetical protein
MTMTDCPGFHVPHCTYLTISWYPFLRHFIMHYLLQKLNTVTTLLQPLMLSSPEAEQPVILEPEELVVIICLIVILTK